MTTQAYFLVAHGSRSPHPQQALVKLAQYVRAATSHDSVEAVGTGCLEFQRKSLAEQICEFQESLSSTCQHLHILPVFLLPGNHVRADIPSEIHHAQAILAQTHPNTKLLLTPHLGSHPAIKQILLDKMAEQSPEAWILLGHGSRRTMGNRAIEQLANSIQAHSAFWATEPGLTDQVQTLVDQGRQSHWRYALFSICGQDYSCDRRSSQHPVTAIS